MLQVALGCEGAKHAITLFVALLMKSQNSLTLFKLEQL